MNRQTFDPDNISAVDTHSVLPRDYQTNSNTRLIPITEWEKHHSWPPVGGMRHLRFHCETNGFAAAFKKVGARVLVDEAEFFRCVDRQNTSNGA